ncbi:MAG: tetratricopeptide repeat protein [Anaerohalosphaeraceae bacterium]
MKMKNWYDQLPVAGLCLVIAVLLLTGCQEGNLSKEHLKTPDTINAEKSHDLAIHYIKSARSDEAVVQLKNANERSGDAEAYCNLGFACIDLGRYQEAVAPLKKAISLKPGLAEAHCNLGIAYIGLDRLKEAKEALDYAISLKPDYAEAQAKLGLTYIMLGHCEQAVEPLKQAISLKPDDAGAHFGLGAAYAKLGNKGPALEQYEILKTLDAKMAAQFMREFQKQEKLMAQNIQ